MNTAILSSKIPEDALEIARQVDSGDIITARRATDTLLQTRPDDYHLLHLSGTIALAESRNEAAMEAFHRAVQCAPSKSDEAMSWNGGGQAMLALHEYQRAGEAFRRAMQADPERLMHRLDFAQALADAGKLDQAEEVLREAMRRYPQDPSPCVRLAGIWTKNGRQQDALVMLDMAKRVDPNFAPAYFNASAALAMLGKTAHAYTACKAALMLDPNLAGYYQLAGLGEVTEEQIVMLRQHAAEDSPASMEVKIDAGFALAVVYAGRGDYKQAFEYLERANKFKHSTVTFSLADSIERIRRLKAFFVPALFDRFRGKLHCELKPIFIVGMPRSGSTLVEQMLAAHPQVQAGGELMFLPNICRATGEVWGGRGPASPGSDEEVTADIKLACEEYARLTQPLRRRHERFTDKLPGNYLFLGMIQLMFPRAAIIHTRRDPFDTCLSCYEHLFTSRLEFTYDLSNLGAVYRLYEDLMQHWHRVLPAGRILDVDYETVVADPEGQLRRILSHCDLPFDAACLNFQSVHRAVTTASVTQVRKPIYRSSVGRWRHYREHLQPLADALGRPLPT